VRHNLSLNKCFEKIEKPAANGTNQRKGCLWAMNPEKVAKMDEEVKKWSRKDPMAIKKAMYYPNTLEALERGEMVKDYNSNTNSLDSEDEEDPRTPASVSSQVPLPTSTYVHTSCCSSVGTSDFDAKMGVA
jgi:hypothetical protein